MSRFLGAVLCAVVLLSACGDDAEPSKEPRITSPEPTATATAEPGPRFASIQDAADTLEQAGLQCTYFSVLKQKDPRLKDFALCDVGDAQSRLNIYLFEDEKKRNAYMGEIVQTGFPWLFGPNWIIVGAGDPTTAEDRIVEVQGAIGGVIPEVQTETASP